MSEVVLQGLGAIYLGRTVIFAARNGYYIPGVVRVVEPGGKAAYMMYFGALLWIVAVGLVLFLVVSAFLGLQRLPRAVMRWVGKSVDARVDAVETKA
ncbi:hypothetical protein K440DRAFT_251989 [Wilcoxina mikolae CBS 423.85]|nr:hypothetical protein K440DRAFT_251989 [Wilcoxina mikolae CBS 423.85]